MVFDTIPSGCVAVVVVGRLHLLVLCMYSVVIVGFCWLFWPGEEKRVELSRVEPSCVAMMDRLSPSFVMRMEQPGP